jgi:hypothetical protein
MQSRWRKWTLRLNLTARTFPVMTCSFDACAADRGTTAGGKGGAACVSSCRSSRSEEYQRPFRAAQECVAYLLKRASVVEHTNRSIYDFILLDVGCCAHRTRHMLQSMTCIIPPL